MHSHWTDAARARHFIIPDDAELAPGDFLLRTATGRERSVDESAVAPYAVTEEEAHAWAKEQLTAVFGEMRQQTLGFVERLRQKTAEMRAENRRTWEQAVADAPPEVREAGAQLRGMLKDLGAALQQAARDHGYTPDAQGAPSASAEAPSGSTPSASAAPSSADPSSNGNERVSSSAEHPSSASTATARPAGSGPSSATSAPPPSAAGDPVSAEAPSAAARPSSAATDLRPASPPLAATDATRANPPSAAPDPPHTDPPSAATHQSNANPSAPAVESAPDPANPPPAARRGAEP